MMVTYCLAHLRLNIGKLVNGINRLGVEDNGHLLSSSLEAEQR